MKDYINEFNEDQKGKIFVPIKCESVDKPTVSKPIITNKETISINEVKELATKLILEYMNLDTQLPTKDNLTEEQKTEIKQKIQEYCNRPGIMSISFRDDFKEDIAEVNALIDPTNRNNWIALKEELIYKLPYSYKNALHTFAAEFWQKDRDLILEADGAEMGTEYIAQLKQQVAAAHKEADARYNEVAHQTSHYVSTNPFDRFHTTSLSPQEGHRAALADGQYKLLKKKAIDLETKLRRLEKRIKKI